MKYIIAPTSSGKSTKFVAALATEVAHPVLGSLALLSQKKYSPTALMYTTRLGNLVDGFKQAIPNWLAGMLAERTITSFELAIATSD